MMTRDFMWLGVLAGFSLLLLGAFYTPPLQPAARQSAVGGHNQFLDMPQLGLPIGVPGRISLVSAAAEPDGVVLRYRYVPEAPVPALEVDRVVETEVRAAACNPRFDRFREERGKITFLVDIPIPTEHRRKLEILVGDCD